MHGSIRDEVQTLRRKVNELQNIKSESDQLRKDFAKIQGEKANLEMDFMKELNDLARENALVIEEYEGRIKESEKVNRALSDQLLASSTPDMVAKEVGEVKAKHIEELSRLKKSHNEEIEILRKELSKPDMPSKEINEIKSKHREELSRLEKSSKEETEVLRKLGNDLAQKINQTKQKLGEKEKEITALQTTVRTLQLNVSNTSSANHSSAKEINVLREKLDVVNKENSDLKTKQQDLVSEHKSKEREYQGKITSLERQLTSSKLDLSVALTQVSSLEANLAEERKTKESMSRDWRKKLKREGDELRSLCESVQAENAKSKENHVRLDKENKALVEANKKLEKEIKTLRRTNNKTTDQPPKDQLLLEQREQEIKQLKAENQKLITSKQSLETANKELKESLDDLEKKTQRDEGSPTSQELETIPRRRLSKASDRPWNSVRKVWTSDRSADMKQPDDSDRPSSPNTDDEASSEERDVFENQATKIIRKLERNLRREGMHKQTVTAGLKFRKQQTPQSERDENVSHSSSSTNTDPNVIETLKNENSTLTEEIDALKQKLEKEQQIVETLRSEVSDLKASCLNKNLPPQSPKVSAIPLYSRPVKSIPKHARSASQEDLELVAIHEKSQRSSLASRRLSSPLTALELPPIQSSVPSRSQSPHGQPRMPSSPSPTSWNTSARGADIPPSPRTPVREFVQTFERRISKNLPSAPLEVDGSSSVEQEPPVIKRTAVESSEASPFSVDEVDELKRTLNNERKQLQEVEEELARQCEINCSLMKDMNSLTVEAEKSRMKEASQFEQKCFDGQKEIKKLSSEVNKLKSELQERDKQLCLLDNNEMEELKTTVENLKNQLSESETSLKSFQERNRALHKVVESLQTQVRNLNKLLDEGNELKSSLANDFDRKSKLDQDEIERLHDRVTSLSEQLLEVESLQLQVRNLKIQLEETTKLKNTISDDYERKSKADQAEIERLHDRVTSLSQQLLEADATKSQLTARQTDLQSLDRRFEELQTKLADSETSKIALVEERDTAREKLDSMQDELGTLQSLIEKTLKPQIVELENKVLETDATKSMLLKEQAETNSKLTAESEVVKSLEATVSQLRAQINEVEERNDRESGEHQRTRLADKQKIEELRLKNNVDMEEIESLKSQLKNLSHDLETLAITKDRGNREDFDNLQLVVDLKVKEFQKLHGEDKEEIERLRAQVEALRQELCDTLEQVEDYKKRMEEKEGVEATIEEMSKLNQKSYEERLAKLQSDLNRANINEKIHLNRIEELEDDMEEMKAEMASEAEDLRRGVDLKDKTIADLVKEKDQLVLSMNSMSSSRKKELEELQVELMDMSTKAADQAREMYSLKQQIEDSGFRQEDVESLRIQVRELGEQLTEREGLRVHEKTALQVENSELRQRLRDSLADKGSSKTVQILRERNAALKYEVEKLTKKLKKMTTNSKAAEQQQQEVESTRFMI